MTIIIFSFLFNGLWITIYNCMEKSFFN